ncbi:hypothetical protein CUMW_066710 [Citrus unshiu]|nr:hypothetical protein CUMW_066710 [Citrus unshiu]
MLSSFRTRTRILLLSPLLHSAAASVSDAIVSLAAISSRSPYASSSSLSSIMTEPEKKIETAEDLERKKKKEEKVISTHPYFYVYEYVTLYICYICYVYLYVFVCVMMCRLRRRN